MKKFVVGLMIVCAVAFSAAMVGCAGANDGAAAKQAFVGSWSIAGMVENGQETSSADLETLQKLGLDVKMTFTDDGKCSLDLFGEKMDGTWEAKSVTLGSVTLENQTVDMTIGADGKLSLEQDGTSMSFTKDAS